MAVKPGDTVRFLHSVGGGVVKRVDGRMAYVEEDGFEIPVLAAELVVVVPAGHKAPDFGAKLVFDQEAFDSAHRPAQKPATKEIPAPDINNKPAPIPAPETPYGNRLNIALAFEPQNPRELSKTSFTAVLVNDSNFYLDFFFATRSDDSKEWKIAYRATVEPNELIDLANFNHENLRDMEYIALQAIAYKPEAGFPLKPVVNFSRKLDLKKFYKLHCFRPGRYFDNPVLEIAVITDDKPQTPAVTPDFAALLEKNNSPVKPKSVDGPRKKQKRDDAENPHKLLPPVEIDLHINELLDSTAGMQPADILEYQLKTVREEMQRHNRRKGQKIIFIHGKGDGVLRQAVLKLLRREYPKAELQDASFQEYGFGATLVTIH